MTWTHCQLASILVPDSDDVQMSQVTHIGKVSILLPPSIAQEKPKTTCSAGH